MHFPNHGILRVNADTRECELVEYGYHNTADAFRAVSRLRGLEPPKSVVAFLQGPLADVHVYHSEIGPTPSLNIIASGGISYRSWSLELGWVYSLVIVSDVHAFREKLAAYWPNAFIQPRERIGSPVDMPAALRGAAQLRP